MIEQNPAGKRSLGRTRMCWKDVIKKDVEQMGGDLNWINLALDRG